MNPLLKVANKYALMLGVSSFRLAESNESLQETANECMAALHRYVRIEMFLAVLVYLNRTTTDFEFEHGLASGEAVKALREPDVYVNARKAIDTYIAKHCSPPEKPEAA